MRYSVVFDQDKLRESHKDSDEQLLDLATDLGLKNFNRRMLLKFKIANVDLEPDELEKVKACDEVLAVEADQAKHAI